MPSSMDYGTTERQKVINGKTIVFSECFLILTKSPANTKDFFPFSRYGIAAALIGNLWVELPKKNIPECAGKLI